MNMAEYIQALENYVASRKLNLGDGESILSLLYEAYGNINQMYDDLRQHRTNATIRIIQQVPNKNCG